MSHTFLLPQHHHSQCLGMRAPTDPLIVNCERSIKWNLAISQNLDEGVRERNWVAGPVHYVAIHDCRIMLLIVWMKVN